MTKDKDFNPYLQNLKGQLADGTYRLVLSDIQYKTIQHNGEISNNLEYVFSDPRSEDQTKTLVGLSLKLGTKPMNLLVALAGGSIAQDVLKDRKRIWDFQQNCIGQWFEVTCEMDERGWSKVCWDGKKRPAIKLIEAPEKLAEPEKIGNLPQVTLDTDDIPF